MRALIITNLLQLKRIKVRPSLGATFRPSVGPLGACDPLPPARANDSEGKSRNPCRPWYFLLPVRSPPTITLTISLPHLLPLRPPPRRLRRWPHALRGAPRGGGWGWRGAGLLPRRSDPGAAATPAAVYAPAATADGGTGPAGIADGRGRDHGGEGLGDTVAALIRAALRCYAREGRMPLLGTDPAGFVLSTANGGSGGT